MNSENDEGWWWPLNSRKAHYMTGGRSLCRKWLCLGNPALERGADNSADNCAECKRRLRVIRNRECEKSNE